mmetsp:Transcript_19048/g.45990  ORF Transcript_19048/g.45990 Transcript_19048/m.45990 type:complete len:313 (+) Transcript_19048:1353-2291(+)
MSSRISRASATVDCVHLPHTVRTLLYTTVSRLMPASESCFRIASAACSRVLPAGILAWAQRASSDEKRNASISTPRSSANEITLRPSCRDTSAPFAAQRAIRDSCEESAAASGTTPRCSIRRRMSQPSRGFDFPKEAALARTSISTANVAWFGVTPIASISLRTARPSAFPARPFAADAAHERIAAVYTSDASARWILACFAAFTSCSAFCPSSSCFFFLFFKVSICWRPSRRALLASELESSSSIESAFFRARATASCMRLSGSTMPTSFATCAPPTSSSPPCTPTCFSPVSPITTPTLVAPRDRTRQDAS